MASDHEVADGDSAFAHLQVPTHRQPARFPTARVIRLAVAERFVLSRS